MFCDHVLSHYFSIRMELGGSSIMAGMIEVTLGDVRQAHLCK